MFNRQLEDRIAALAVVVEDLNDEVASLRLRLNQQTAMSEEQNESLARLNDENVALRSDLETMHQMVQSLKRQVDGMEGRSLPTLVHVDLHGQVPEGA